MVLCLHILLAYNHSANIFVVVFLLQVSSQWCSLANNNEVWKVKYHESFIYIPRHLAEQYLCWKELYRQARKLHFNWTTGLAKRLELCGHKDKYVVFLDSFPKY